MREAPSLDNVPLLLEAGAELIAFDPVGEENFRKRYPEGKNLKGAITYVSSAEEAIKGTHLCFVFTEWPQIRNLKPETFKQLMHTPLVYDGRNLYSPKEMREAGVEYYSIGRK